MSGHPTEETEVLLKEALSLLLHELAIFIKLGGEVRLGLFLVSIATASISITRVTGVALSTVVVFIFVGSWIFSGHLRMALPILGVDRLGKGMEFVEGVRLSNMGNLILDAGWKSMIQLSVEGGITPLDMGSESIEVDKVLHDVLVVTHC